MYLTIVNEIS